MVISPILLSAGDVVIVKSQTHWPLGTIKIVNEYNALIDFDGFAHWVSTFDIAIALVV